MNTETLHTELLHEKTARKKAEDLLRKQEDTINSLNQQLEAIKNDFQKNIKEQTGKIQSIAMFSLQSPDPQLRISFDGNILFQNIAAKNLSSFFYEGNYYEAEAFWKYLFQVISPGQTTWRIEAKSRSKIYSFTCRVLNVEGYINIYGNDITEKKEAEQKLKEYESHFRAALDAIGDNVWEHDFKTGKATFSKSPFDLLGYTLKESSDIIALWWMSTHADDKRILEENDAKYKKGLIDHHSLEYRLIQQNGSIKWILDRGKVIETAADGKPLKIIGTHTDITERKIAEEVIRESEMRFKDLAQRVPGVVYQWQENNDGSYGFTYVSPKLKDYFDIEPEDADKIAALIHPEDKERWRNTIDIANQKEIPWEFEGRLLYPDGSIRWWRGSSIMSVKKETGRLYNGIMLNITAQKENEQRILKAEQLYKFALEGAGDGVWEHDFIENKVFYSSRYKKMLGYEEDEFNNDAGEWRAHLHPEDKEKAGRIIEDYKNGLIEKHSSEYRIRCKDESYIWVLDRGMLIEKTANGKPKKIIGTHAEITKRKQLEEQVQLNEKRFRDLFNFSQAMICTHDLGGKLLTVNPFICKTLEYGESEMVSNNLIDFLPEKNKHLFQGHYLDAITNNSNTEGEFTVLSKSGKKIHLLYRNYKVEEPGLEPYVIGFSQDITERKNTEEIIRKSEEKYRGIIENMNLGLMEVDNEERIIYANQSFCDMSGYTQEDLILNIASDFFIRRNHLNIIKGNNEQKKGVTDAHEAAVKNKRGELKWWLISGAPLLNQQGQLKGSIGIHLDITQQKILERELRKAKQEAERSSSAKEIFLANMSHEIRTPMNAILNMGHQLQKTGVDEKQGFYISTINTAASNLLIIINDILDFSKIEAGKLTLERIGFRLSDVINHSFCVIKQKAEEKGLLLEYSLDENIFPVFTGDPHRLNQVFINLLSNAIKFTDSGYVKVDCTIEKNNRLNQVVQIKVSDTGIGMSEQFLQHLFVKFSQEDESAARKYGGTGLGMSICKQLIELMGGSIQVKSQRNNGTQIFIVLPFEKGSETDLHLKNKQTVSANTIAHKKILLVEDNEMNRVVAITILNSYEVIVDQAENGQIAIDLLKKNTYDLILMDIRMPVMDGLQATGIIRKEINKEIPIIALTANTLKTEQQKCLDAGINDFLSKPFEENDLINLISKWLNKESEKKAPLSAQQLYTTKLFNLSKLNSISRGNDGFIEKMISIFTRENKKALEDMLHAFNTGNIETINSIAHKIKPSIDNMGIVSLKDDVLKLEKFQASQNSNDDLKKSVDKLNTVLNIVFDQLNQLTEVE